jgi:hypothetical protein
VDDFKVYGVPAELSGQAVNVWPYINRALEHGAMETLEYLAKCVERGGAQLWAVFRGSELCAGMVTEIQDRPRGRVCVITAAGGDDITAEGCAYCIEQITPWARSQGCGWFEINGRRGWGRHLGWGDAVYSTFRRVIS